MILGHDCHNSSCIVLLYDIHLQVFSTKWNGKLLQVFFVSEGEGHDLHLEVILLGNADGQLRIIGNNHADNIPVRVDKCPLGKVIEHSRVVIKLFKPLDSALIILQDLIWRLILIITRFKNLTAGE